MASFFTSTGLSKVMDGTIPISGCKVMLTTSAYTPAKTNVYITNSGAGAAEIAVSGYTGGFGGPGRQAVTPTIRADTANNRVEVEFVDITWTALAAGATIEWAVLVYEVSSDATSWVVAVWDVAATTTNGGNLTLDMEPTDGNLQIAV